jgi:hypothetical protein
MFYTGFTSASLPFLHYLQGMNSLLAGVTKASIRKGKRAHSLVYAKADSHKLANFMYYASGLPSLTRKRLKLEGFINIDRAGIISQQARVVKSVNTLA